MQGFLNFEGEDFAAFVIAALGGFAAGTLVSNATWSVYVSILVSYHLFLAWLVYSKSSRAGLSMPLWLTALTHAACMVVVVGPAVISEHHTLGFGIFRYGIAALALFETEWLFSKEVEKPAFDDSAAPAPPASDLRATSEDELAWLDYLQHRRPGMTRHGTTIRQEREDWMRARIGARTAAEAKLKAEPVEDPSKAPAYLPG